MAIAQVVAGARILISDLNAYYSLLKGSAGESLTNIYNAAGAQIFQPSSDPAATTQLVQIKNNAGTVKSALTSGGGLVLSNPALFAQSTDIASSGTTDLSAATGNYVVVTGTTTITAFGTVQAGTVMVLKFSGILTLTHNASSLILRAAANATTAAGDVYAFVSEGSGNWREVTHLTSTTTGLTQISKTTLGSAQATIAFSSIPATYTNLQVWLQARGDTAATQTAVNMQFNTDSGANYDYELLQGNTATAGASETFAATSMNVGLMAAANAPANVADQIRIDIANYAGTTFQKSAMAHGTGKLGTTTTLLFVKILSGWWRSTAAISTVTLLPAAGNFATGTVAVLYGLQ